MRAPRLLAPVLLLLTACASLTSGSGPRTSPDAHLQHILDRGELRVGVTADQPPLNMRDRNGDVVGFEIDIVQALAHAMGLELRLVVQPFADLLPGLERGETDLVISGLTMTPERNARVAFAGPYYISGMSVLSRAKEIVDVEDPVALDVGGRRYAALAGTTSEKFVRDILPKATLLSAPDYEAAVQMVIDGRADALLADSLVCSLATWRHPDAGLRAMATPFTVEPLGIAIPPDAPLLLNLVDNYVDTLEYTGLLASFKAKWLADGSWMKQLPR